MPKFTVFRNVETAQSQVVEAETPDEALEKVLDFDWEWTEEEYHADAPDQVLTEDGTTLFVGCDGLVE